MFDLWGKLVNAGGRAFVERHLDEFSPLEWVELGERYPDLVSAKYKDYDWRNDPLIIRDSPFLRLRRKGNRKWKEDNYTFRVNGTDDYKPILATAYIDGVIATLKYTDVRYLTAIGYGNENPADGCPAFGCSCGDARCDGFCYERCHVSRHLVHWTIERYNEKYDLFYDRESYDLSAIKMLRGLLSLARCKNARRRRACGIRDIAHYEKELAELEAAKGIRKDNLADFKADLPWCEPWDVGTIGIWVVGLNYSKVNYSTTDRFSLRRELDNQYDKNAIAVWDDTLNARIGYLPRFEACILSQLVDDERISLEVKELGEPRKEGRAFIRLKIVAHDKLDASSYWSKKELELYNNLMEQYNKEGTPSSSGYIYTNFSGEVSHLNAPALIRLIYWVLLDRGRDKFSIADG